MLDTDPGCHRPMEQLVPRSREVTAQRQPGCREKPRSSGADGPELGPPGRAPRCPQQPWEWGFGLPFHAGCKCSPQACSVPSLLLLPRQVQHLPSLWVVLGPEEPALMGRPRRGD